MGSRDGGPFETPIVTVFERGLDGRIQQVHEYDLDQLDEARAQFEAIRAGSQGECRSGPQLRPGAARDPS